MGKKGQGNTYNPSKVRRRRKTGFRKRNSDVGGKNVLKSRRKKGRHDLAVARHPKQKRAR